MGITRCATADCPGHLAQRCLRKKGAGVRGRNILGFEHSEDHCRFMITEEEEENGRSKIQSGCERRVVPGIG